MISSCSRQSLYCRFACGYAPSLRRAEKKHSALGSQHSALRHRRGRLFGNFLCRPCRGFILLYIYPALALRLADAPTPASQNRTCRGPGARLGPWPGYYRSRLFGAGLCRRENDSWLPVAFQRGAKIQPFTAKDAKAATEEE